MQLGNRMVAIHCRRSLRRLISLRWCGDSPNNPISPWRTSSGRTSAISFFLDRIPLLQYVQAAWLLVVLCATGNYMSGGTKCASRVLQERNSDVASFGFLRRRLMTQDRLRAHLSFLQVRAAQRHADSTDSLLIQLSRLSANDHLCGECWRDRCSATPHRLPKEVLTLSERFRDCVKLKYHRRQDFPICGKISSFKNSSCSTFRQLCPTTAALTDGNGSPHKISKSTHLQNESNDAHVHRLTLDRRTLYSNNTTRL